MSASLEQASSIMSSTTLQDVRQSLQGSLQGSLNDSSSTAQAVAQELIPTPTVLSISSAASVESFYRSFMNAKINHALTGVKGAYFPQMHVQLPVRVLYINGFKGVRKAVDEHFRPAESTSNLVKLGCAITPGIVMTPVSSILEACNANLNPEPLHVRWTRGIAARGMREVIFGLGLNQLSEEFEAFVPQHYSSAIRNALGSMMGGVLAGYLSHVPHNLSTMKLMNPSMSYAQLFRRFSEDKLTKVTWIPASFPAARRAMAMTLAVVWPKGLLVRTGQVVGSFIILNGIINVMSGAQWSRAAANDEDDL
ncbi:uncharacterized protein MONBRDRAFT_8408 [Monosiga brevicollis MX1]|uniref:Uncharacterized protein n=1 Tax=Monosiga brevicollis TaxID=81824 RepID=A9UZY9_MONBE|nr:uncharacterized protein MONBRDRAFT_8408 [Monosiga brevicollis MX1]EDQ89061.1 predicted protein [Monosiga brevicollis MX1]|eukprot:XP_001746166.1 hypothetical protein [Monosiga brevicollis MX1]